MSEIGRSGVGLAGCVALVLSAHGAAAATVVHVELSDTSGVPMATTLAYGTPGLDMTKATMAMKTTPLKAPAGVITFKVKNVSKDTVHEMIVMYLADPAKPLPYIEKDSKVDEDMAGDKGEVSELEPGKSGQLTLDLKPGKYLLICNVAGHFAAGMWSPFEVTK